MAVKAGVSSDGVLVPNATGTVYSLGTGVTRAVVTSAVAYANSAVTAGEFYIVPNGGSASTSNRIVQKDFAANESYTLPELIGQSVESGGVIQANDGGGGGTILNFVITVTEFSGDS